MRKTLLIFLAFIICVAPYCRKKYSGKIIIKGRLIDSRTRLPLKAQVRLKTDRYAVFSQKDRGVVELGGTDTDFDGMFSIGSRPARRSTYSLFITSDEIASVKFMNLNVQTGELSNIARFFFSARENVVTDLGDIHVKIP